MSDLISRQAAIDAILAEVEDEDRPIVETRWWNIGMTRASVIVHDMPSAEEMAFNEWCTDCKEYNHEKGCCPRFNRVIRETVEEVKEAHSEKQGHWIENGYGNGEIVCSNCGEPCATFSMARPRDRYCKWCGAKMEREENE